MCAARPRRAQTRSCRPRTPPLACRRTRSRSPERGRGARRAGDPAGGSRPPALRKEHRLHLVRTRVALREEPGAATRAVVPPLALHARDVAAEVVVRAELAEGGRLLGPRIHLTAEAEVGDLTDAAVRAGEDEGHAQLQGYGLWETGCRSPLAKRSKRNGCSKVECSPRSTLAISRPTAIIL